MSTTSVMKCFTIEFDMITIPIVTTEQLPIAGELFRPDHEQEDYNRLLETARQQSRVEHWLDRAQREVMEQRSYRQQPERFDAGL